jgi:hypothetical protein
MTKETKPVAKSLHTLTVLQQVARMAIAHAEARGLQLTQANAMIEAMCILGLHGRPDPYGLQARALELMQQQKGKGA